MYIIVIGGDAGYGPRYLELKFCDHLEFPMVLSGVLRTFVNTC